MFKKPSTKDFTSSAVKIGAGVAGAKVSDGIVAAMPESTKDYKKIIVAVVALGAAAATNPKTLAGEAVQAAFVGAAIKQGTDAVTEMLVPEVTAQDNSTVTGKFINGVIGHSTEVAPVNSAALNRPRRRQRALNSSVAIWEAARPVQQQVMRAV